jgi:hypothetical protein
MLWPNDVGSTLRMGAVRFSPGAYCLASHAWARPLHITEGSGVVQTRDAKS